MGVDVEAGGFDGGAERGGDIQHPLKGFGKIEGALALTDALNVLRGEDGGGVCAAGRTRVVGPAGALLDEEREWVEVLDARGGARYSVVIGFNAL